MEQNGNIVAFPERRFGLQVSDLRSWHYMQVTCRFCGHCGRIYPASLWRRCRMNERIVDVVKRFRCRHCGGCGVTNWEIWQLDRNA
jgi:hypothetical protein